MMKLATLKVSFSFSSLLLLHPALSGKKDSRRTITNPLSVWTRNTTGSEAAGPFPAQRDGLWREANLGIALFKSRRHRSSGHVEDDCNNDAGRLYATLICFSAQRLEGGETPNLSKDTLTAPDAKKQLTSDQMFLSPPTSTTPNFPSDRSCRRALVCDPGTGLFPSGAGTLVFHSRLVFICAPFLQCVTN
jgi:hypothetical protein